MADPERFDADPDPTFQADADPDPENIMDLDLDQQHCFKVSQSHSHCRVSVFEDYADTALAYSYKVQVVFKKGREKNLVTQSL